MRQKATRQKSRRQKAIRRTYKQVIKGGDPFILTINWGESSPLFGFFNKQGDSDDVIFNKINTYLDMFQIKLKTYADKTLLMSKLEEANKAINRFEAQRFQMYHDRYNGGQLVLKLRKRVVAIRKILKKAISDETAEANKGKHSRAYSESVRRQRKEERTKNPREYTPPIENEINLPPAPMGQGNKFNGKEHNEFYTMMSKLEQQKAAQSEAQSAVISPSQKRILNEI